MIDYTLLIAGLRTRGEVEAANTIEALAHREKGLKEQVSTLTSQIQSARRNVASAMAVFATVHAGPDDIYYSPAAQDYFAAGKLIHTIKQLREDNPGLGLTEAKRFVDSLRGEI